MLKLGRTENGIRRHAREAEEQNALVERNEGDVEEEPDKSGHILLENGPAWYELTEEL